VRPPTWAVNPQMGEPRGNEHRVGIECGIHDTTNQHVQSKLNNAVREGQHLAHLTLASFSCSRRAITAHQLVQSDLKYVKGPFHRQDAEGELEMGACQSWGL